MLIDGLCGVHFFSESFLIVLMSGTKLEGTLSYAECIALKLHCSYLI